MSYDDWKLQAPEDANPAFGTDPDAEEPEIPKPSADAMLDWLEGKLHARRATKLWKNNYRVTLRLPWEPLEGEEKDDVTKISLRLAITAAMEAENA